MATTPCRAPYAETFVVLKVLGKVKQRAKFQHRISMQYVIPIGLPLYVPKNRVLGVLSVTM